MYIHNLIHMYKQKKNMKQFTIVFDKTLHTMHTAQAVNKHVLFQQQLKRSLSPNDVTFHILTSNVLPRYSFLLYLTSISNVALNWLSKMGKEMRPVKLHFEI